LLQIASAASIIEREFEANYEKAPLHVAIGQKKKGAVKASANRDRALSPAFEQRDSQHSASIHGRAKRNREAEKSKRSSCNREVSHLRCRSLPPGVTIPAFQLISSFLI